MSKRKGERTELGYWLALASEGQKKRQRRAANAPTQMPQPRNKKLSSKLLDFFEHNFTLSAIFGIGALVGYFMFTPFFILCGIALLFAFQRKVLRGMPPKAQSAWLAMLAAAIVIGFYFLETKLNLAQNHARMELAEEVASVEGKTPQPRVPKPFAPPANLGVYTPKELPVTIPPNSEITIASGRTPPGGYKSKLDSEETAAEMDLQSPKKLTLRDLFFIDFSHLQDSATFFGSLPLVTSRTGSKTTIKYGVVKQLPLSTEILKFYVPYTTETPGIIMALSSQYRLARHDWVAKGEFSSKEPGDSGQITSKSIVFSRRIFVYYETYVHLKDVVRIQDAYKQKGLSVILRSTDYLANKKLELELKQAATR